METSTRPTLTFEQRLKEQEIAGNYKRYKDQPQDRDEHGQLTDVLAQTFEQRMNNALHALYDLGKVATRNLLEAGDEIAA